MNFVLILAAALSSLNGATRNVKSYGAVGNGVTDDSAALQAAINACSPGDTVLFPAPGNYYVSHTLAIHSNCTYAGQAGSIISGYTGTGSGGYSIFDQVDTIATNITISGLIFDGGGISFGDTGGTANVTITGNTIENILNSTTNIGGNNTGIYSGNTLLSGTISNNTIQNIYGPGEMDVYYNNTNKTGMTIYAASNLTISNNSLDSISSDAIDMPYGSGSQQNVNHPNVQILNNTIMRDHRIAIEIQMYYLNAPVVSGNYIHGFYKSTGYGISFAPDNRETSNSVLQYNITDMRDYIGNQYDFGSCYEVAATNTLFDSNTCRNGVQTNANGIYSAAVAFGGVSGTVSNNYICGSFSGGWFGYEPPQPITGKTPTLTNNTVLGTCSTAVPDMTLAHSHAGDFQQGGTGSYSITASNVGTAPTSGTVTVTDTLPSGLTPATASGSGWSCSISSQTVTCTRSDALSASSSYPAIFVSVNVSSSAPSSVTNTATISGGGETNTSNDSASDTTVIGSSSVIRSSSTGNGPVPNDFLGSTLNTTLWTFLNPVGDGRYSVANSDLSLVVPAGSNHDPEAGGQNNSVRVVEAVSRQNLTVQVKFDSIPNQQYQFEGILVNQDAANFLRFQVAFNGQSLDVDARQILGGTGTQMLYSAIALPKGSTSIWLQVENAGGTWTESWSADGIHFTKVGSFNPFLTVSQLGLFAGNYNSVQSSIPGFTAKVNYMTEAD